MVLGAALPFGIDLAYYKRDTQMVFFSFLPDF